MGHPRAINVSFHREGIGKGASSFASNVSVSKAASSQTCGVSALWGPVVAARQRGAALRPLTGAP